MKKRIPAILALTAIMMLFASAFAFAGTGDLKMISSYPEDGQKNTSMENVGVKVKFATPVGADETLKANMKRVRILDDEGKAIPVRVVAKGKELLVMADMSNKDLKIKNKSEYTVVIDPDFADNDGNTLGKETTITFETFNQKVNNTINMVMMFVMMGGVMVLSLRQMTNENKDKEKKKAEESGAAFNPYREAKRTGKSVDEVIAEEEARKAKKARKNARKEKQAAAIRAKLEEDISLSSILPNVYSVKKPAPISKAGSKHVSGRAKKKAEPAKKQQSKTRARTRSGAKKKK